MKALLVAILLAILGYVIWMEVGGEAPPVGPRKRLCDYYVSGSVFEDPTDVIAKGIRLLEIHVYSDESDQPIVSKKPLNEGYDYAYDNWTFESVCVKLNDAFPSKDPMILSIVPHTTKITTLNRMAYHLNTTVRKNLLPAGTRDIHDIPLDQLAGKLVIVSGNTQGSKFDELVNLSWSDSTLRRLTYHQAIHSRDQPELVAFNRNAITMVSPDESFKKSTINPETLAAYGCQWSLFENSRAPKGFVEKPAGLQ
jgi:hypothetical protein